MWKYNIQYPPFQLHVILFSWSEKNIDAVLNILLLQKPLDIVFEKFLYLV